LIDCPRRAVAVHLEVARSNSPIFTLRRLLDQGPIPLSKTIGQASNRCWNRLNSPASYVGVRNGQLGMDLKIGGRHEHNRKCLRCSRCTWVRPGCRSRITDVFSTRGVQPPGAVRFDFVSPDRRIAVQIDHDQEKRSETSGTVCRRRSALQIFLFWRDGSVRRCDCDGHRGVCR
jgi:hypothetical protein